MRILITNDDGIHAKGLEVLKRIAKSISDDVWTCAPERDQSGVAHSLTINSPLRLREVDERSFCVDGTPTDCVIMGAKQLMDDMPDLILSGVNSGQNISDFITYSGTIAGALEGCLLDIPSIALSQAYSFENDLRTVPWQTTEVHASELILKLFETETPERTFYNVNFPNCQPDEVEGVTITSQGTYRHEMFLEERKDGRNFPYHWLRFGKEQDPPQAGTDIKALSENKISVTPLQVDLTNHQFIRKLQDAF